MSTPAEFIAYLDSLGADARVEADRLLISPAGLLRDGDAEWIRANKAELMAWLTEPRCQGVCPGPETGRCAGCPSPTVEIQFGGGLIANQWCTNGIDRCATHWREKGGWEWIAVEKEK